jgi:hypothetical protein
MINPNMPEVTMSPSISTIGKRNQNKYKYLEKSSFDYVRPPTPKIYKEYSSPKKDQPPIKNKKIKIEPIVKYDFCA